MTSSEGRLRLFVAVELPAAWREALASTQQLLARALEAQTQATPRLRWTNPEGIHLTLKFLGEVASERRDGIEAALAQAVPAAPGLTLRLGGLGCFASGRRLRVVWAGLEGEVEALTRLAAEIDAACEPLGFEPERRPFAPHLTLARAPESPSLDRGLVEPLLRQTAVPAVEALSVQHVALMRSHLGRGGARYERLRAWPSLP